MGQVIESSPGAGDHRNVLDFALNFLGCTEEQDLYYVVARADVGHLEGLLAAYRDFASRGMIQAPDLVPGELRPYFSSGQHMQHVTDWIRGGLALGRESLRSEDTMWSALDRMKHRLLYCHSVALDDPFPILVSGMIAERKFPRSNDSLAALQSYVQFLLHSAPLIRSNILCLVSSPIYSRGLADALGKDQRHVLERNLRSLLDNEGESWRALPIDEIVAAAPQETRQKWQDEWLGNQAGDWVLRSTLFAIACQRIATAFGATANVPMKLSPYLPFRYDLNLLGVYQRQLAARANFELPDAENWLLSRLIDVELPGIAHLDPEEIVAIRTSSDVFEQWRNRLRDAIAQADLLPTDIWERREAVRARVAEQLKEGQQEIEKQLPRSKLLAGARQGLVSMAGGTLSATLSFILTSTSTLETMIAGLAGALGSATVAAIAKSGESAGSTREAFATQAMQGHYVALLR